MKNFAQNPSFLKTLSVCMIFSGFGINSIKCVASDEVNEEGNGKVAKTSAAPAPTESLQLPLALIEPGYEENLALFWGECRETYQALTYAAFCYRQKKDFEEIVAQKSEIALPHMTSFLKKIRVAHQKLLEDKKDNREKFQKLKKEKLKLEAQLLLEDKQESIKLKSDAIPENPTQDEDVSALKGEIKRLKEAEQSLRGEVDTLTMTIDHYNNIISKISFWKPWTWHYLLSLSASTGTPKV